MAMFIRVLVKGAKTTTLINLDKVVMVTCADGEYGPIETATFHIMSDQEYKIETTAPYREVASDLATLKYAGRGIS